jgi:hypothetical protein
MRRTAALSLFCLLIEIELLLPLPSMLLVGCKSSCSGSYALLSLYHLFQIVVKIDA